MVDLESDTKLTINTLPNGKFTFTLRFRGELQPTSRPMVNRDDVEMLGKLLLAHMEKKAGPHSTH